MGTMEKSHLKLEFLIRGMSIDACDNAGLAFLVMFEVKSRCSEPTKAVCGVGLVMTEMHRFIVSCTLLTA